MANTFIDSKFYKFLRAVLNVGFWIAAAAFLASFFLLLFKPETAANLVFDGFTLSGIDNFSSMLSKVIFIVSTDLMMLLGVFCVWMLRDVVNSLKIGSPFSTLNVKRIRLLGWALFAVAYLRQAACYITADRMSQVLSDNGMGSLIQARFQLIPEGAVLAICVLLLAEVFRYGCMLQNEHDTTI